MVKDFSDIPIGSLISLKWDDAHEGTELMRMVGDEDTPSVTLTLPKIEVLTFGIYLEQKGAYVVVAKEILNIGAIHYNCIPVSTVIEVDVIRESYVSPELLSRLIKKVRKISVKKLKKGRYGDWIY